MQKTSFKILACIVLTIQLLTIFNIFNVEAAIINGGITTNADDNQTSTRNSFTSIYGYNYIFFRCQAHSALEYVVKNKDSTTWSSHILIVSDNLKDYSGSTLYYSWNQNKVYYVWWICSSIWHTGWLWIKIGIPQSNGGINWGTTYEITTAQTIDYNRFCDITVDSNGKAVITYRHGTAVSTYYFSSIRNNNPNSIVWATEWTKEIVDIGLTNYQLKIAPLLNGRLIAIYTISSTTYYKIFDGSNWGTQQSAILSSKLHSITYENDTVHIIYADSSTGDIKYGNFTYPSTIYKDTTLFGASYADNYVQISKRIGKNQLFVTWTERDTYDSVYFMSRNSLGKWSTIKTLRSITLGTTWRDTYSDLYAYDDELLIDYVRGLDYNAGPLYYTQINGADLIPPTYPPELLNMTLNNIETGETWIFKNEVHELVAYLKYATYAQFQFNDTQNLITFNYNSTSKTLYSESENLIGTPNELVLTTIYAKYTEYPENITKLVFRFIPSVNIVDSLNRYINYTITSYDPTEEMYYDISGESLFNINIYNLGGQVEYTRNDEWLPDNSGKIIGGDEWELYVKQGQGQGLPFYIRSDVYYKRLQAIHLLTELDWGGTTQPDNPEILEYWANTIDIQYGIDYRLQNSTNQYEWVEGWKVVIGVNWFEVGTYGVGNDKSWVELRVDWWNRGALIKRDYIYSYCYAYDISQFPLNRTSYNVWVDLWFSKANSSTVIAGRVNSYYHGMFEDGNPWWFGYGAFRPMIGNETYSNFAGNLMDADGHIINTAKIDLVRTYCKLVKYGSNITNAYTSYLRPYEIKDFKVAGDRLEGIDTPIYIETKMINIPQEGFLSGLYNAISNIGNAIGTALFSLMKLTISGLDTLLVYFGFPSGFLTKLIEFLTSLPDTIFFFLTFTVSMLFAIKEIMEDVFLLIFIVSARWIIGIGYMVYYITTFIQTFLSLISGGFGAGADIWTAFNLEQVLYLVLALMPVWWFVRIASSNNKIKAIHDDVKAFRGFSLGLVDLFIKLSEFVKSMIMAIVQTVKG